MFSPRPELRRFPRHSVTTPCQIVHGRQFKLIANRIADLSMGGLLAPSSEQVLTGDRLLVSFKLPLSTLWIDTEATVARVIHGRRPGDAGRALGLEFDDLDFIARHLLAKALHAFPRVLAVPDLRMPRPPRPTLALPWPRPAPGGNRVPRGARKR